MVKKKSGVKKKSVIRKKSAPRKVYVHRASSHGLDEKNKNLLIENFVGLQKVVLDLSTRTDSLVANISKLLNLFESSAEALVKKNFEIEEVKKKKQVINEASSRPTSFLEREKSFGSNNLLSQVNNIPEFQRIPSNNNSPYPSSQGFQNAQFTQGGGFQNANAYPSQNQNNFGSSIDPEMTKNSYNNQNAFDNSQQKNSEGGLDVLPMLPGSSSNGEIPGSGEGG